MTSASFNRWFGRGWLLAGFAFLYLPILALVIYSFNDSPVPNVWRGFTLKWYAGLAADHEIINGLWLSLRIAFFTACGSVVLGTLAAVSLVKYRRFRGRTVFSGHILVRSVAEDGERILREASQRLARRFDVYFSTLQIEDERVSAEACADAIDITRQPGAPSSA